MPSRATHKTSKMIGADGGDLAEESEAKKKKKKERDPLDWEDDKFPKMADRPVEQAQIDPSYLAKMRQEAKKQYIEALGPDPAKVQRTWKFHFGICALENVTQNEWEVFLAVSETGNKFDQFKNRLHGNFQYTKGYKVRGGTRKKFKRMEQVYSKEHNLSYKQMQNHFVTMDVWTVSKLQFNTLLGTAKRSFYDLANDNVYQYIGIKAAGQAQAQKGAATEEETQKKGFQIGNVFVQCLCSEIMRFDIALNNWQFLPKPELKDNTTKKKLRLGIPTGPKKGNDTFETEPSDPPVYSWARGGMFIYKGTKESLNNEVLTIEVLGQKAGQWAPQGKALVGLRGAIDYPIAVGVALRAALQASRRKIAASAGFGLFQTMRSWARGKSVPMALVNLVLAFAAERPSLLQALEGREWELPPLGHWWEESERRAQPVVEDPEPHAQAESLGVAERQPAGAGTAASSSNDMQAQPDGTSEKESGSDQDTTNDLLTALRNSKSDNPPLSGDGVVIFRLTRKAHAEEVNAVLFDATGPLWPLHRRVLEAGCEVAPEWSPIKALFVPLTQPQLQELAQGNIYELGKVHLLALQSDAELLTEAFNGELQRSVRPKLRRETPRRDDEEEGARDHEPLLVMEGGIHDGVRTDSDLGYPVYEA